MVGAVDSAAEFGDRRNAELLFCAVLGTARAETFSGAASRGARAWLAGIEHIEPAFAAAAAHCQLTARPRQLIAVERSLQRRFLRALRPCPFCFSMPSFSIRPVVIWRKWHARL